MVVAMVLCSACSLRILRMDVSYVSE